MASYKSNLFGSFEPVDPLILANFSSEELAWIANKCLGGMSVLKVKEKKSDEAELVHKKHGENPQFLSLVMQTLSRTTVNINVPISPFNVSDELQTLDARVTIVKAENQVTEATVVVDKKEYRVPMVLGLMNPTPLAPVFPGRVIPPWDFQAANAAFYAGCLTEQKIDTTVEGVRSLKKGRVQVAVGTETLANLRMKSLSESILLLYAKQLSDAVPSFGRVEPYTGTRWAHVVYVALMGLEPAHRMALIGRLNFILFNNTFVAASFRPPSDSENMLMRAEANSMGAQYNPSAYIFQKKAVDVTVPQVKNDPVSAYAYLRLCRAFRGKDDVGMSGMSVGAYGAQFTSREHAKIQRCVSIISYLAIPKDVVVYVTMSDARVCLALHATFPERNFRFPGHMMKAEGVNFQSYVADMAGAWHIDFSTFNLEEKSNRETFDQYAAKLAQETSKRIDFAVTNRPLVYVSQAKILSFDVRVRNYEIAYLSSPTPHNMVTTVVAYVADREIALPAGVTLPQMCALSNAANSFRNLYFLHRMKISGHIEKASSCHLMPLVSFRNPRKVKFDSYADFVSLQQANVDLDPDSVERIAGILQQQQMGRRNHYPSTNQSFPGDNSADVLDAVSYVDPGDGHLGITGVSSDGVGPIVPPIPRPGASVPQSPGRRSEDHGPDGADDSDQPNLDSFM